MIDEEFPSTFEIEQNLEHGISVAKNKEKKQLIINAQSLNVFGSKLENCLIDLLAKELEKFFEFDRAKKVLIVGLGNSEIFNDALGPVVAKKLVVSRGLNLKPEVSVFVPDVFSNTGIETCEIVKSLCEITKPNLVVLIDAFSTISVDRLCCSFQAFEGGLSAGSGASFKNKTISKDYLGVEKVVSIGVPMLIFGKDLFKKNNTLSKRSTCNQLILSPSNIKQSLKIVSNIIAMAINQSLFKNLSKEEIKLLIE